jgi:hypothetical protein
MSIVITIIMILIIITIIKIIMIIMMIIITTIVIIIVLEMCICSFFIYMPIPYLYILMSIYVQRQHQMCHAVAAETRRSWICRTLMFLLAIVVVSPGAREPCHLTVSPQCQLRSLCILCLDFYWFFVL